MQTESKTTLKCGNKNCNNEFVVKTTELCKGKSIHIFVRNAEYQQSMLQVKCLMVQLSN